MNYTKSSFIKLALESQVLQFGSFTLKSGRQSPYFFNTGLFYQGKSLDQLGQFYAQTLIENKVEFDHLFGPAYKGFPLATATAIALSQRGKDSTVTFNRKEVKNHGEGGQLIGAPLTGKTVIIDDVITAGTAFRQAQTLIKENGGQLTAVVIALDRCEPGLSENLTISEIKAQGIDVYSIIDVFDLIKYLEELKKYRYLNQLKDYLGKS
jgi:orotate phosphoribosyltransferase